MNASTARQKPLYGNKANTILIYLIWITWLLDNLCTEWSEINTVNSRKKHKSPDHNCNAAAQRLTRYRQAKYWCCVLEVTVSRGYNAVKKEWKVGRKFWCRLFLKKRMRDSKDGSEIR